MTLQPRLGPGVAACLEVGGRHMDMDCPHVPPHPAKPRVRAKLEEQIPLLDLGTGLHRRTRASHAVERIARLPVASFGSIWERTSGGIAALLAASRV